ncbi:MAG TPA: hypothetical protein VG518_07075 [Solirubrobacterales bacterium]|nr:hypothetical protein [Solirubrobacterales bacterium]
MSKPQDHTPVVPLEAGAGPNNPPCPACGEPLFGWLGQEPGLDGPVRRCESCGLGVIGEEGSTEEALRGLARLGGDDGAWVANRASVACSLGGAGWAGLEPGGRYLYTVEAARRLIAGRDQVIASARWAPGAGLAGMWQTILNSLTFGRNVALGALGRSEAVKASRRWQQRIDGLISVVLAIPALVLALPLELSAAAIGRGAVVRLRYQLL